MKIYQIVEDYNNEFEPGTLVRHIEMNINQYGRSSAKAPGDNSIYHFVNKKLSVNGALHP